MQLRQWRIRRIHFYVLGVCHLDDINPFKVTLKLGIAQSYSVCPIFNFLVAKYLALWGFDSMCKGTFSTISNP